MYYYTADNSIILVYHAIFCVQVVARIIDWLIHSKVEGVGPVGAPCCQTTGAGIDA